MILIIMKWKVVDSRMVKLPGGFWNSKFMKHDKGREEKENISANPASLYGTEGGRLGGGGAVSSMV